MKLIESWVKLGRANHWIRRAADPPFSEDSLKKCESAEELAEQITRGSWCLGQGFYWRNQCWINQVGGGDEWLVIKDEIAFESVTARAVAGARYSNDYRVTEIDKLEKLIRLYDRTPAEELARQDYKFDW